MKYVYDQSHFTSGFSCDVAIYWLEYVTKLLFAFMSAESLKQSVSRLTERRDIT